MGVLLGRSHTPAHPVLGLMFREVCEGWGGLTSWIFNNTDYLVEEVDDGGNTPSI